jgi:hypothetical protein
VCAVGRPSREEVEVSLGAMGRLRGVVTHSKPYPNQQAPNYARPIYMFRNIPYAEYSVAGERRFTQSVVRTTPYTLPGTVSSVQFLLQHFIHGVLSCRGVPI